MLTLTQFLSGLNSSNNLLVSKYHLNAFEDLAGNGLIAVVAARIAASRSEHQ
jgi:hypothetical protein